MNNEITYDIEELANNANQHLNLEKTEAVSVRLIRDYQQKGLIDRPFIDSEDSRKRIYTEDHLQDILKIKSLQQQGYNQASILLLKKQFSEDINTQRDAKKEVLDVLSNISPNQPLFKSTSTPVIQTKKTITNEEKPTISVNTIEGQPGIYYTFKDFVIIQKKGDLLNDNQLSQIHSIILNQGDQNECNK